MKAPILVARRDLLRTTQNADGGWGYFAGKQSWMEPTAYAILALHGDAAAAPAVERAWKLVKSMQLANGGWKPAPHVAHATWVTALGVTLCTIQGEFGRPFQDGVRWLLTMTGAENSLVCRILSMAGLSHIGRDTTNRGWPWREDTAAWVEPTAHSLVALKKAALRVPKWAVRKRITEGERLLLTVRSADGGWNYGSASALGVSLPSYPETTALALLGLQERAPQGVPMPAARCSRLSDAWTSIVLAILGRASSLDAPPDPPADLMIAALEALAAPGGNAGLLKAEAA